MPKKSCGMQEIIYRTRAIITRGLYVLPHFSVQERLILQTIYVHKQGKLGLKSAVYNQERFQIKRGL